MPLFRPFPSRRWLKESLANAQHELVNARTDVKIMDAYRVRDFKRIAFLEAQVRTQAQTIADLDADQEAVGRYRRAALHRLFLALWASRRRWQESAEDLEEALDQAHDEIEREG